MLILSDSGILLRMFHPADPLHATVKLAVDRLTLRGEKLVSAPQNVHCHGQPREVITMCVSK